MCVHRGEATNQAPRRKVATHVNRVPGAITACALLLVAACGAGPYSDAAQQLDPLAKSASGTPPRSTAPSTRLANQRTWDNGLSVAVSAPKLFTPTDAALPRSPRAV